MARNKFDRHKDSLFSTLAEITSLIIAGNDKRVIFDKLLSCCITVLGAERVYLLEFEGRSIIRYSKQKDSHSNESINVRTFKDSSVLHTWMIREGLEGVEYHRGGELALDLPILATEFLEDQGPNRVIISAPMVAKKSMFGLLVAIHPIDGGIYAVEDLKLLTVLANQAAISLENQQLYQKLEKEAITDGLTSVYNYRFLISALEREIKRAKRFKQTFSFIMMDVDNLKEYNDRLGHLAGSQALKEIARTMKAQAREVDLVCKYGGDEFAILLPQTSMRGAEAVAQRILEAIARYKFDGKTRGLLTCSAGVATFPEDGRTVRALIASADKVLYQSKRTGKNRVLTTRDTIADVRN
jgi:diguanylate cyclase (GGDEF)-like protein